MIDQADKSRAYVPGERILKRIAGLTLGFGFAAGAIAVALHRADWAKGLVGGAVLGWLNFRWLRRGMSAMVNAALAQAAAQRPAESVTDQTQVTPVKSGTSQVGTYFALVFRYALVAIGVYVIFVYLHVPLVSIGLGLCALIAAIIAASVWEIVRPAG